MDNKETKYEEDVREAIDKAIKNKELIIVGDGNKIKMFFDPEAKQTELMRYTASNCFKAMQAAGFHENVRQVILRALVGYIAAVENGGIMKSKEEIKQLLIKELQNDNSRKIH